MEDKTTSSIQNASVISSTMRGDFLVIVFLKLKKKTNNQIKQKQPKENMKNTTKQTKNQSSSTDENITALTLLKEK